MQRRFAAIPKSVIMAVQPAVLKEAHAIADTMERFAPEDTGDLKASIAVTGPGRNTPAYSQPGGSMTVPSNAASVTVGDTDVRYAHLVEYGHGNGLHGTTVPPHPFFWPAVRLHNKKAKTAIKNAIRRAVKKEWGK